MEGRLLIRSFYYFWGYVGQVKGENIIANREEEGSKKWYTKGMSTM